MDELPTGSNRISGRTGLVTSYYEYSAITSSTSSPCGSGMECFVVVLTAYGARQSRRSKTEAASLSRSIFGSWVRDTNLSSGR
ncbi:hypothetical protein T01_23 [Trichinella spiralis]|uniref:Uncharacterized protein n=1 Tax=Trichinella spiralis TaxID=6334 RepID=A0A0V1B849_TRISP|nr:hypothetical protein T01_23 [Trichinella spiralis]